MPATPAVGGSEPRDRPLVVFRQDRRQPALPTLRAPHHQRTNQGSLRRKVVDVPKQGLPPTAVSCQSCLQIPLSTAHIKVMTALKGETPKVADCDDLRSSEMEEGEINAAVHGVMIACQDASRRVRVDIDQDWAQLAPKDAQRAVHFATICMLGRGC